MRLKYNIPVPLVFFVLLPFFVGVGLPLLGAPSAVTYTALISLLMYFALGDLIERYGPMTLRHVPMIPSVPIIGPLPFIKIKYAHLSITRWAKKLGPVFRIRTAGELVVIASSYEAIRDVCITNGKTAGGRPMPFLTEYMLNGTGILFSHKPDKTWKSLRMASQKHLKQFGDGLSHIQHVISDVSDDMFATFKDTITSGTAIDPKKATFDAALNTISFLLTGVKNRAGDEIIEKMRTYENTVLTFLGSPNDISFMFYEKSPWLRHLNMPAWLTVQSVKDLQASICKDVKELSEVNPDAKSLFRVLMAHVAGNKDENTEGLFSDSDVNLTIMSLLLAGVTTTSTAFYSLINVLAHRPHIQDKLYEEVKKVGKTNDPITLDDRQEMPYCRAVLFEILRYASVVPLGVPHRTVSEVDICGSTIPENIMIGTNIWGLHHDPDFWADPESFIPERFLDDDGNMVPADHPNRKHLIPFGAGPRVCLGEAMALARIFLWIANLAQKFEVFPAEGNTMDKSEANSYEFGGVIRVCPYEVKFVQRPSYHG